MFSFPILVLVLITKLIYAQIVQGKSASPIVIKGAKFFYQDSGDQFFIKGLIYQQIPSKLEIGNVAGNLAASSINDLYVDALADAASCTRDLPYMQKLQTNVVRLYGIDPSLNHTECMTLLANAGIYVLVDLVAPGYTISTTNPVWNDVLYNRYASVIDAMQNYTNMLGFIVGDDVASGVGSKDSGPYIKAAVRDMKAYIREKNYRSIPVGYVNSVLQGSNAQASDASMSIWNYLNCGDQNDAIDFWGANIVAWCKDSTFTDSGYNDVTTKLKNYSIPTFLAAYGCSIPLQRDFSEIHLLYSFLMTPTWSGGIIYEYFGQLEPGYGLVTVSGAYVATVSNFDQVSSQMATVSPSSTNSASYNPTNTATVCPAGAATSLPPNPRAQISISGTSTTSATATSTPQPSPDNGLSVGAKAGVAIGAVALAAALLAFLVLMRRRSVKKKAAVEEKDRSDQWTKTELPAEDVDPEARGYGPLMADSTAREEMEGTGVRREVADDGQIYEAPGDTGRVPELGTGRWSLGRRREMQG